MSLKQASSADDGVADQTQKVSAADFQTGGGAVYAEGVCSRPPWQGAGSVEAVCACDGLPEWLMAP